MAKGVGAAGNQKHAPVLDTLDFSIKNAQLRWIALVVRRVDGEHGGLDSIQSWRWVVVAGGLPLVQVIVRIACEGARQALFEERIGFFTRRRNFEQALVATDSGRPVKDRSELQAARLIDVVAAHPFGVVANRFGQHAAQHPVAPGHLGGQRGHGDGNVHDVRVALRPHPGLHTTHRVAQHQTKMLEPQVLRDQPVLRFDHVVVVVLRELGAQPV